MVVWRPGLPKPFYWHGPSELLPCKPQTIHGPDWQHANRWLSWSYAASAPFSISFRPLMSRPMGGGHENLIGSVPRSLHGGDYCNFYKSHTFDLRPDSAICCSAPPAKLIRLLNASPGYLLVGQSCRLRTFSRVPLWEILHKCCRMRCHYSKLHAGFPSPSEMTHMMITSGNTWDIQHFPVSLYNSL